MTTMTHEEFDSYFDAVDLMDDYMDYMVENCHGERMICNGDMLIIAAEEGYLYEAFRDDYIEKRQLS
jgi:hypothetical protein